MKDQFDLSIIIPTLNEAKRIGNTLDDLAAYLKTYPLQTEVVIVDAHSPDKTVEIALAHAKDFKSLRIVDAGPRPKGKFIKGKQVKMGMLNAHGRYVMFMDADLATPLKYLENVRHIVEKKQSVGICVRDLQSSHKGIRKAVSGFGNFLVQLLILPGISDTQCGFKVFEASAAHKIFTRQTIIGWGFDMEILAIARKLGYQIDQISVPDWHDVEVGSKIGGTAAIKAALQTFPDLVKIKWGLMTGRYKKEVTYVKES
ncbi:glycosyltransferase [Candidatus Saccharibacteria bacterium]|nr:glycosyltransferase [Candidatus Saccharibacteria bacterium]